MSEALPDPSLPIFGDKTVEYEVVRPRTPATQSRWDTVEVLVDEIDSLEDPRLSEALWDKFKSEQRDSNATVYVFASPEGRYNHAYTVRGGLLGVEFTEDGIIEAENLQEYRLEKSQERVVKEQKSANWLVRIFKK